MSTHNPEQEQFLYYAYAIVRPKPGRSGHLPAGSIGPHQPLVMLEYGTLGAVLSAVPSDDFDTQVLQQRLEDAAWVQAQALTHQQVVAALLDSYTVAPLSFCTLYRNEERVRAMLAEHYDDLDAMLQRLEGATEWGVKVFYDRRALVEWVMANAEELAAQRAAMSSASEGAQFFLRKKLDKSAEQLAVRVLAGMLHAVRERLITHAREEVLAAIQPRQLHGHNADMALNAAYLVDDEVQATFCTTLTGLTEIYAPRGLTFELTGPWPAYHFVRQEASDKRSSL